MQLINKLLIILLASLSLTGCNSSHAPHYVRAYEKAELDALIRKDMSVADITNTFGAPGVVMQGLTQNSTTMTYLFSPKSIKQTIGLHLVGFNVSVRGGQVVGWSAIDGESFNASSFAEPPRKVTSFGKKTFKVFVEQDGFSNVLEMLDSKGSADVRSITVSPDMVVSGELFSAGDNTDNGNGVEMYIMLNAKDVPKLQFITANSHGKRLLIACSNEVIAAPKILAPINTESVEFCVKDSAYVKSLK